MTAAGAVISDFTIVIKTPADLFCMLLIFFHSHKLQEIYALEMKHYLL